MEREVFGEIRTSSVNNMTESLAKMMVDIENWKNNYEAIKNQIKEINEEKSVEFLKEFIKRKLREKHRIMNYGI